MPETIEVRVTIPVELLDGRTRRPPLITWGEELYRVALLKLGSNRSSETLTILDESHHHAPK